MLKIGIVGLGGMGLSMARRCLHAPGARLWAVADAQPERLEADLGGTDAVRRYADARQLSADPEVDVALICLPTYMHARATIEALEAGKHVLCEKPMALNLADADRMIEAARRAGRQLMVAHCIRFWPEYRYLRQCARDGRFGRLLSLSLVRISGRPGWAWDSWFLDAARSGGATLDMHIHDADFALSLLGWPAKVQTTRRLMAPGSALEVIHALWEYEDGPQVHLQAGWGAAPFPWRAGFEAWFERGFVRYDGSTEPALQVYGEEGRLEGPPEGYAPGDAYAGELAYFLECVAKNAAPEECLPEDSRESLRMVLEEMASTAPPG